MLKKFWLWYCEHFKRAMSMGEYQHPLTVWRTDGYEAYRQAMKDSLYSLFVVSMVPKIVLLTPLLMAALASYLLSN